MKAESYRIPITPGKVEEEKVRKEANFLIAYFINTLTISIFTIDYMIYKKCFSWRRILKTSLL